MSLSDILMIIGFALAAYSIIANDSIQTLGTFIASNAHRSWWVLWAFAALVLIVVVGAGWYINGGDPAYGRLEKFPWPENGIEWFHVLPPLVILVLTRFGIPVSTTFLVLVVFNPINIGPMLLKSISGYVVAFIVAILTYRFVIAKTTEYFDRTQGQPAASYWVWLQWLATAFLWSQWLIQDLANIFVYVPREISAIELSMAVFFIVLLQGVIFYQMGGAIQKIVTNKTGTADIRAATIIDFIYAIILLIFKEWSNMPMSTTWVFIGLLAGRQIAITLQLYKPPMNESRKVVISDAVKAGVGLLISVILAMMIPFVS